MPPRVQPVVSGADRRLFASLARRLHPRSSPWVRPIDAGVIRLIRGGAFIAWDGKEPIGRIHAMTWDRHARLHGERAGFFGLLDAADAPEVMAALMSAAEGHVRERGATILRGPYNLTVLSDGGLVESGYEHAPAFGMAWTPPHYLAHLTRLGYAVCRRAETWLNPDITALDHRAIMRHTPEELGVGLRPSTRRRLRADLEAMREAVCAAFLGTPDFVPPTAEEWEHQLGLLVPVLDPSLLVVAEVNGAMVGASLGVPDFNRILARLDGSAWHAEAAAFFRSPPCDAAVLLLSALHRAWQGRGIGRLLNAGLLYQAQRRGYRSLAGTWVDERNAANRRQVDLLGMRPLHRLVFVERALA
jgi:GNAT superfamily N-acetyltransferase